MDLRVFLCGRGLDADAVDATKPWSDGIAPAAFRQAVKATGSRVVRLGQKKDG